MMQCSITDHYRRFGGFLHILLFRITSRPVNKKVVPCKKKVFLWLAVEAHRVETSRLPHFLDNRLTDGGEIVRLTRRPPFTPQKDFWHSFLLEAESIPRVIMRVEGLGQLKNPITSSGIVHVTYRLVAQCLTQLATACLLYQITPSICSRNEGTSYVV
jgi:hypothetical protein